jgi:hypothetical protein
MKVKRPKKSERWFTGRRGEFGNFCSEVPRLRSFVLLIRAERK